MKFLYTIHDITADIYHAPFVSETDGAAKRFFSEQINAGDSNLRRYPDQYRLIRVGGFDPDSGDVVGDEPQTQLGTAADFLIPDRPTVQSLQDMADDLTGPERDHIRKLLHDKDLLDEKVCPSKLVNLGPEQRVELENRIRGRIDAANDQNQIDIENTLNPPKGD